MKSVLTAPQRIGLGMVALFYGELAAVPLYILAVMFRFPSNWWMLWHYTRFTLLRLLQSTAFEGLIATITWMVFGSLLVAAWQPANMRKHRWLAYLVAVPLAGLAPALLAIPLWRLHRQVPQVAIMDKALFIETFLFMLASSDMAIHRYMKFSAQAEKTVAAGGEFRF
jgi:hypothetical protein